VVDVDVAKLDADIKDAREDAADAKTEDASVLANDKLAHCWNFARRLASRPSFIGLPIARMTPSER